jgi:hypothetical protein
VSAADALYDIACDDMPVAGPDVLAAMDAYRNEVLDEVLDLARNRIESIDQGLPKLALVDFAIMVKHLRTDVPPERVCPGCGRTQGHKMDCAKGRMS